MLTLLSMLFYLALIVGVLNVWALLCRRYFQVDPAIDSVSFVETADGWRLALSRLATEEPRAGALPVLLCPGLGMSGNVFHIGERPLAAFLRDEGYDVWSLDPRGRGSSSRPRLWGRHAARWSFDDLVEADLPAAVAEVCRRTGAPQVHVVGFGMGGLGALCFAGGRHEATAQLGSVASIAGPAFFARQERDLPPRLLKMARLLPTRGTVWALSPLVGRRPPWPLSLLCNVDNTDAGQLRRVLVNSIARVSGREIAQLARWIENDELTTAEDRRDYRDRLAAIAVPALLVLGPRDRLAPATMMQRTSDVLVGAEKELLFAGREGGMSSNYGHLDLLIGAAAVRDLFPQLAAWLARQATVAPSRRPAAVAEEPLGPPLSLEAARGSAADPQPLAQGAEPEADPRAAPGRFRWHDGEDVADDIGVGDAADDDALDGDPLDLVVGDVPNLPEAR